MGTCVATKDRFDLEQDIMACWSVVDDIKQLNERLMDGLPGVTDLSTDQLANILLGLESIYQMKFERLFDTYSQVLKLDVYNPAYDKWVSKAVDAGWEGTWDDLENADLPLDLELDDANL